MDEMWNQPLDRDNLKAFYDATVEMVFPSVFQICKESTRTEQAIVKSYVDTYQQRNSISGEDVLFVFGDILLKNANEIIDKYPLPENMTFAERGLDEYTRNAMLEKINAKIDSRSFKVSEFISSDSKKAKNTKGVKSLSLSLSVSPLLIFQLIVLALIIWGVSYLSVTLPYKNNKLIPENEIPGTSQFKSISLKDEYISILSYLPLNIDSSNTEEADPNSENSDQPLAPSFAEPTSEEPKATRG